MDYGEIKVQSTEILQKSRSMKGRLFYRLPVFIRRLTTIII